jgi:hypothetical protein
MTQSSDLEGLGMEPHGQARRSAAAAAWSAEDEALVWLIERDRRLRAGSLRLSAPGRPCPGCSFCQRAVVEKKPTPAAGGRCSRQGAAFARRS